MLLRISSLIASLQDLSKTLGARTATSYFSGVPAYPPRPVICSHVQRTEVKESYFLQTPGIWPLVELYYILT